MTLRGPSEELTTPLKGSHPRTPATPGETAVSVLPPEIIIIIVIIIIIQGLIHALSPLTHFVPTPSLAHC
jgi:hypothetical protein